MFETKQIGCPNCGYEGPVKRFVKGSVIVEFGLWILLIIPALIYSLWLFALGLIYTLWRSTSQYDGCPACGWAYVVTIPTASPEPSRTIKIPDAPVEVVQEESSTLEKFTFGILLFGVVIGLALVWMR